MTTSGESETLYNFILYILYVFPKQNQILFTSFLKLLLIYLFGENLHSGNISKLLHLGIIICLLMHLGIFGLHLLSAESASVL